MENIQDYEGGVRHLETSYNVNFKDYEGGVRHLETSCTVKWSVL